MPDLPKPRDLAQQYGEYALPWIETLAKLVAQPEEPVP